MEQHEITDKEEPGSSFLFMRAIFLRVMTTRTKRQTQVKLLTYSNHAEVRNWRTKAQAESLVLAETGNRQNSNMEKVWEALFCSERVLLTAR